MFEAMILNYLEKREFITVKMCKGPEYPIIMFDIKIKWWARLLLKIAAI